jgi:glyoxylase-like metal-dependent hydrolase (beta-lactamase superfamily II)
MSQDVYRFAVGNLDCIAVRDASEVAPVRDLVLDIDDPAVAKAFAARGWSTGDVPYDFLALFVRAGRALLAIDVGWGASADHIQGRFAETLAEVGVAPGDVTYVILTHLDDDHAGGVLDPRGELAFPGASHVIDADAWDWYTAERNLAAMPRAAAALYGAMKVALESHVQLTQGETEIIPGVRTIPAPGHRLGHVAVELVSEGKTLLHLADTVLHPIVVEHPEWRTGYDSSQEKIRETRRRLFDRAAKSDALVFLSHAPFPGLGHITREGAAWRWRPLDDGA